MALTIAEFSVFPPDSVGDRSVSIDFLARNPTKEVVRLVHHNAVVTDEDGFPVCISIDNRDTCVIEPGEELMLGCLMSLQQAVCGGPPRDLAINVSATMYARDFIKLGELEVPSRGLASVKAAAQASSSTIDGNVKVNVIRGGEYENGDSEVRFLLMLRSTSNAHLQVVKMNIDLLDRDGVVVDKRCCGIGLSARSVSCIEGGFAALSRPQLKGAKFRLSLSVFRPIHVMECSARGPTAGG